MPDQIITRDELAELFEQLAASLRNGRTAHSEVDAPGIEAQMPPSTENPSRSRNTKSALRSWGKVADLEGERYTWPTGTEEYDPFEVWETDDAGPRLQFGLGYIAATDAEYYGRPRGYWLAFEMVNGQKRRPIGVFIEGDEPTDLVAVIKGKGPGGRSMYGPGDELPPGYNHMTVDVFRDRVNGPQAFSKLAVVAENADRQTMLNHAAIQSTLRS